MSAAEFNVDNVGAWMRHAGQLGKAFELFERTGQYLAPVAGPETEREADANKAAYLTDSEWNDFEALTDLLGVYVVALLPEESSKAAFSTARRAVKTAHDKIKRGGSVESVDLLHTFKYLAEGQQIAARCRRAIHQARNAPKPVAAAKPPARKKRDIVQDALAAMAKNEGWTLKRIAEHVGGNYDHIRKHPKIKASRANIKRAVPKEKGFRNRDTGALEIEHDPKAE